MAGGAALQAQTPVPAATPVPAMASQVQAAVAAAAPPVPSQVQAAAAAAPTVAFQVQAPVPDTAALYNTASSSASDPNTPALPKAAPKIRVSSKEWYDLLAEIQEFQMQHSDLKAKVERIRDEHEPGMVGC